MKLLDCLEYQCDESSRYEETETANLIDSWRKAAYRNLPEYQAAKWDID